MVEILLEKCPSFLEHTAKVWYKLHTWQCVALENSVCLCTNCERLKWIEKVGGLKFYIWYFHSRQHACYLQTSPDSLWAVLCYENFILSTCNQYTIITTPLWFPEKESYIFQALREYTFCPGTSVDSMNQQFLWNNELSSQNVWPKRKEIIGKDLFTQGLKCFAVHN
jgi:hypothetical protein